MSLFSKTPATIIKNSICVCITLLILIFGIVFIELTFETEAVMNAKSNNPQTEMNELALLFEQKRETIQVASDCFPINVRDLPIKIKKQKIMPMHVSYLFCTDEALENDGKPVVITENFEVSKDLARRFNFWRRVYSLWSHDQYTLHVGSYPEVVLEIVDASSLGDDVSSFTKNHYATKHLDKQLLNYRALLSKMHSLSRAKKEHQFTPTMKRVEHLMKHINDKNKYKIALQSLRIQRGQQEEIKRGLEYASPYSELLRPIFKRHDIPEELFTIAFIESSFNKRAESKVGAKGIYQIMPDTAMDYRMLISNSNEEIDERVDPVKAADAAARLLKQNYKISGAWPLAITAYNHGIGSMKKAIDQTGSKDISVIIDKYQSPSFKFASKNFYTGFLAILHTIQNKDKLFPSLKLEPTLQYTEVKLRKDTSLKSLQTTYKITQSQIFHYNPDIPSKYKGTLPRGFTVKIPIVEYSEAKS